jgi:hypothetical protein
MRYSLFAVAAVVGLSGCASMFMNGGNLVDAGEGPTAVKRSYKAPQCAMTDGSSVAGPADVTFQLVDAGIFERSSDGSGAVITNHWADAAGDHYFGWVKSSGWEYVIPQDPNAPANRLVYVGLDTKTEGSVTKPATPVSATCPLVASR